MPDTQSKLVKIGNLVFVQACAKMMSAAWIRRQIVETSTAPPMNVSGIAYELRHTVAADIGMGFELALKSLSQGLSDNEDGNPQVLKSHDLTVLWMHISDDTRFEIDKDASSKVCEKFGSDSAGKVLPFAEYLKKHHEFLGRTVDNRYGIEGDNRWMSDHRFAMAKPFPVTHGTYKDRVCADGNRRPYGVLVGNHE